MNYHQLVLILILVVLIRSRDCYLSCDQLQITYDKQICFRNCDQKIIIGVTIGVVFFLCFLICAICFCRNRDQACMYFYRRKLKDKFNHVDPGAYTLDMFKKQRDEFLDSIQKSDYSNNFFFQVKRQKCIMTIQNESVTLVQQADFLTRISFKGKDNYSPFLAQGFFLCKQGNPYVWFFKRYENYDRTILQGLAEIVLFQSVKVSSQGWSGCWFIEQQGQKKDSNPIHGKWTLITKVVNLKNRLELINSETILL